MVGSGGRWSGRGSRALRDLVPVTLVAGAASLTVAVVVGGSTAGFVAPAADAGWQLAAPPPGLVIDDSSVTVRRAAERARGRLVAPSMFADPPASPLDLARPRARPAVPGRTVATAAPGGASLVKPPTPAPALVTSVPDAVAFAAPAVQAPPPAAVTPTPAITPTPTKPTTLASASSGAGKGARKPKPTEVGTAPRESGTVATASSSGRPVAAAPEPMTAAASVAGDTDDRKAKSEGNGRSPGRAASQGRNHSAPE